MADHRGRRPALPSLKAATSWSLDAARFVAEAQPHPSRRRRKPTSHIEALDLSVRREKRYERRLESCRPAQHADATSASSAPASSRCSRGADARKACDRRITSALDARSTVVHRSPTRRSARSLPLALRRAPPAGQFVASTHSGTAGRRVGVRFLQPVRRNGYSEITTSRTARAPGLVVCNPAAHRQTDRLPGLPGA